VSIILIPDDVSASQVGVMANGNRGEISLPEDNDDNSQEKALTDGAVPNISLTFEPLPIFQEGEEAFV
jgi:hypothetical protein